MPIKDLLVETELFSTVFKDKAYNSDIIKAKWHIENKGSIFLMDDCENTQFTNVH